MLNISLFDQNQLFNQSQLKKLSNNSYLTDVNDENFKYIKEKFFFNETDDKAKLLNVGSGLFAAVNKTISYYVGEPNIDFKLEMDKYVSDYVSLGYATIGIERSEGKLQTVYLPAENYWNDNGLHKILRLYISDDREFGGSIATYYTLVQEYGVGYIESKLYRLTGTSLSLGKEVALDTIDQTKDISPRIDTKLETPSIYVVKDDELEQYPISITQKIKNLVYAVDRHIVMQHTQFLQNVESFILMKGIRLPQQLLTDYNAGKKINFSQLGRVISAEEGGEISFVNNTNDLIEDAMKENDNLIRRISSISSLPIDFLGLDSSDGAIGEGSRTLKHGAFYKMIQSIRELFDRYIKEIAEIVEGDTEYTRPDVMSKSDTELVEFLKTAREAGIISLLSAVKQLNGYDTDEAEAELELIKNESLDINIDDEKDKTDTDIGSKTD